MVLTEGRNEVGEGKGVPMVIAWLSVRRAEQSRMEDFFGEGDGTAWTERRKLPGGVPHGATGYNLVFM